MKKIGYILPLIAALACSDGSSSFKDAESRAITVGEFNVNPAGEIAVEAPNATSATFIERKLIKTGQLTVKVDNVARTKTEVDKIIGQFKAYLSNEEQNTLDDRIQQTLVIKVPAASFDELVKSIEALASKVEYKSSNIQDVTEEFIDVEARLNTKKDLAARYREILKQAKTVTDIVAIEGQLATVQSEIDSMEGRLKYLKDQVSYSTLNLIFYESIGADFGFGSKLASGIGKGWDNLLLFIVGLVNLWPFVLLGALGIWLFLRARKRRRNTPHP